MIPVRHDESKWSILEPLGNAPRALPVLEALGVKLVWLGSMTYIEYYAKYYTISKKEIDACFRDATADATKFFASRD